MVKFMGMKTNINRDTVLTLLVMLAATTMAGTIIQHFTGMSTMMSLGVGGVFVAQVKERLDLIPK